MSETDNKPKFPPSEKMTTKSLTRADMEEIIRNGESVMYKGVGISTIAELPTAAELAEGDPAKEQAVLSELRAQIAALQSQVQTLTPTTVKPKKPQTGQSDMGNSNENVGEGDSNNGETPENENK